MANDPVSIANRALTLLGVRRIVSFTEASAPARSVAGVFDQVRDSELRAHVWNFALTRVALPGLVAVPVYNFTLQYAMPVDCLQLVSVGDYYIPTWSADYIGRDDSAFAIEGRTILINPYQFRIATDPTLPAGPPALNVRYVADISNTTFWDALFCESMACKLAEACCMDLTESDTKLQTIRDMYKVSIRRAVTVNAIEKPPTSPPDDTWVLSRL